MGKIFTVDVRALCKICGKPVPKRYRTFCSKKCRNKDLYKRYKKYNLKWAQKKRGEFAPGKIECLECGRWYVQICTHVIQAHGYGSAREYKETYDLEVKKGVIPEWYRELKGEEALKNGTFKNLQAGERFRFKPGDPKAGLYHRSHITIDRIRKLHTLRGGVKNG
jgi:endogenous inhibitor of DNA gyrase (YacG/DUF329 family)